MSDGRLLADHTNRIHINVQLPHHTSSLTSTAIESLKQTSTPFSEATNLEAVTVTLPQPKSIEVFGWMREQDLVLTIQVERISKEQNYVARIETQGTI